MRTPQMAIALLRVRAINQYPPAIVSLLIHSGLFALGLSACSTLLALERPPQLIAIAFDNCTELARWDQIEKFLTSINEKSRVRFTFFLSGTNFLQDQSRNMYQPPRQPAGQSNIGFGGSRSDVEQRVEYINRLHDAGHEIASHAVGHFYGGNEACGPDQPPAKTCGARWTVSDWTQEFNSFNALFRNVGPNNKLTGPGFQLSTEQIVGFRAPQLSVNPALYETLRAFKYRYDTSWPSGAMPDAWPQKDSQGTWLFKLARLNISDLIVNGQQISNLSMDYNICASQLRARGLKCETTLPNPDDIDHFGAQTIETYLSYFRTNYAGNRAPLHIGHHFYGYQDGIYNKALLAFASAACAQPEVQCVTYRELADFMDRQDPATLAAFQQGNFDRGRMPELLLDTVSILKDVLRR